MKTLLLSGLLSAALVVAGCQNPTAGPTDGGSGGGGGTGGGTAANDGGTGGGTGGGTAANDGGAGASVDGGEPDPIAQPSTNPSSYGLIDQAVDAGVLSEEQGALYKLYADFGATDLPAQYRGDDVGLIEGLGGTQFTEYVARVGSTNVSTPTLEAAWPYFVPPYYEGSWWNRAHPSATKSPSNPTCRAWNAPCSVLKEWRNVQGTHVVVWYESTFESTDGPRAAILANEFDTTIWPKLTSLMGLTPLSDVGTGVVSETDARLDVVLIDLPSTFEGQTYTLGMGCKQAPAIIYLSRALPMHGLEAQAAHEMMHAIQLAIPVKALCASKYTTMVDATAVWATNYVYPTNDWEHRYSSFYLANNWYTQPYDVPPGDKNKGFAYGAWLLPLFLETKFGPTVVKAMWDATLTYSDPLPAIDGALLSFGSHIEKVWPDFVAANWNRDTLDTYRTVDRITDSVDFETGHDATFTLGSGGIGTFDTSPTVEHAAASYYRVKITDTSARSLSLLNGWTFKRTTDDPGQGPMVAFDGLSVTERHGAALQVFLKVKGTWQPKPINLNNVMWLTSCRDDPAGAVEEVVFMFSNAEISSTATNYSELADRGDSSGLLATSVGCRDWVGSLSMTNTFATGTETLTITNATLKNAASTAIAQPGGEPATYPVAAGERVPMGYGFPYSLSGGTAKWTYSATTTDCTYTGNQTKQLPSLGPVHLFSNYAPVGNAGHGVSFTGFLGLTNAFSIDWTCTDSQGKVTSGTDPHSTPLDVTADPGDPQVRVNAAGLSVTGTAQQTSDPDHSTGIWSLTGQ